MALFHNYGMIANDHPIPPFHPYFRKDLPQIALDLDRAKWHINKGGLSGVRLPIYALAAAEGSVDMTSILQEYASRVGLNLAVNRIPADGYWSTHWMKHPLGSGNCNPRPTADTLFSLLVEAKGERDERKRKDMYGAMQALVKHHCGVVIPAFINLLDGYDRRLKGLSPNPLGGFMGHTFAEHVWWQG